MRSFEATQLETERLVLRLPQHDDVDDLLAFVGDDDVMRRIGGEAGGRESAIANVELWRRRWQQNGVGQFAVVLDGHAIGRVGVVVWDTRTWEISTLAAAGEHAEAELGWALSQAHWGRGYATEASLAARDWARAERGIARIVSLIAPGNVRSQRVAEKLGARVEQRVETAEGVADLWVHP